MALKEVKVRIADLHVGMYVSRLDRPWLETPYLLQGFHIVSEDDIEQLMKYCTYVYIDVELSKEAKPASNTIPSQSVADDKARNKLVANYKTTTYENKSSQEEELVVARESHRALSNTVEDIMRDISKNEKLNLPPLQKAVTSMVDSIIRNPNAYVWLTRMKHKDSYTYNHSVSAAVWAVAFGRHLGLPKKELQSLALGALMFDIGKMKLPDKLINNPKRYNQYEFKLVKQHVNYSMEILKNTDGIEPEVIDMVYTHHERHNGSGYPRGLAGDAIPLLGKIAGIVDCYDAIISERPFASPLSPHDAVKKFYEWRDIDFQAELVEQFIQVIGIYPVGTIVELSDGQIGVIVAQHNVWRLRPQVMMLLDTNKEPLHHFGIINLYTEITDKNGNQLNIIKCVEPGLYGIDPEEFYL
jgi:putative nucleotidyltransferase with HDIG domain